MKNLIQRFGKDFYNNEEYKDEHRKNTFAYRAIRDEFNKTVKDYPKASYYSRNDYIMSNDL